MLTSLPTSLSVSVSLKSVNMSLGEDLKKKKKSSRVILSRKTL